MSEAGVAATDVDQQSPSRPTFKDQAGDVSLIAPVRPTVVVTNPQDGRPEESGDGQAAVSALTGPEDSLQQEAPPTTLVVEAVQVSPDPIATSEPYHQPTNGSNGREPASTSCTSKENRWKYAVALLGAGVIVLVTVLFGCFTADVCSIEGKKEQFHPSRSTPSPTIIRESGTLSPVWNPCEGNCTNRRQQRTDVTDVMLLFHHMDAASNERFTDTEVGNVIAVVGTVVDTFITTWLGKDPITFDLQKVEVERSSPMVIVDEVLEVGLSITIYYTSNENLDATIWVSSALYDNSDLLRKLRNVHLRFQRVNNIKVAVDGIPLRPVDNASASTLPHLRWDIILGTLVCTLVNVAL